MKDITSGAEPKEDSSIMSLVSRSTVLKEEASRIRIACRERVSCWIGEQEDSSTDAPPEQLKFHENSHLGIIEENIINIMISLASIDADTLRLTH